MKLPKKTPPPALNGLDELNELVRQVRLVIATPSGPRTLAGRLLTPAEESRLRDLIQSVLPPVKPVKGDDGKERPAPDYADEGFLARQRAVQRQVRALAVVMGVPAFAEAWAAHAPNAGFEDLTALTNWVETQATAAILDTLQSQVISNADEQARVHEDFFSGAGFPAS